MGSLLALPIAAGIALLSNKIADVGTLCKWIIAYANITLHRRQTKPRFDLYDFDSVGDPFKIGLLPPEKEVFLESPQDESHLIKAADEVFFYGVNSSSECFMARVSRVCSDEADVGLYIKLRNGKTYETEKVRCLQQTSKSCSRMFTGGGLKMYYREPMRRWRIFFKGLLKETSGQDDTKCRTVYVKFGLQWRTSTDCFDALSDINCSDLATALAGSKWEGFLPDLTKFHDAVNSYSQGGVIRGEIHIDGVDEDIELYVFGEKIRYLGNATKVEGYRFSHTLGHVTKNGRIVHMTELHIPQAIKSLIFGYVITPEGKIESATNIKVKEGHLWNEKALALTLRTDETDFILKATLDEATPVYDCGIKQEYQLSISNIEFDLNTRTGRGILLKGHIANSQKRKVVKRTTEKIPKDIPLTVDFSDDVCQISDITGGKGSSLVYRAKRHRSNNCCIQEVYNR